MKTKRNIRKKSINKTKKKQIGGVSNDTETCVYYFDLLKEIHNFFTIPFEGVSDRDKFITLYNIKSVLNSITGTLDENSYTKFIDVIKNIFKDSYKKFKLNSEAGLFGINFGYSKLEKEFAQVFLTRIQNVYLAIKNKTKNGNVQLGLDYISGKFKNEIDLFNNCCSFMTWNIDIENPTNSANYNGEKYLHDIIAFMMADINEKDEIIINTELNIPVLEKYVHFCFLNKQTN